jgi:hypothetical protein
MRQGGARSGCLADQPGGLGEGGAIVGRATGGLGWVGAAGVLAGTGPCRPGDRAACHSNRRRGSPHPLEIVPLSAGSGGRREAVSLILLAVPARGPRTTAGGQVATRCEHAFSKRDDLFRGGRSGASVDRKKHLLKTRIDFRTLGLLELALGKVDARVGRGRPYCKRPADNRPQHAQRHSARERGATVSRGCRSEGRKAWMSCQAAHRDGTGRQRMLALCLVCDA